ncbi:dihydropteroate synthase [Pseudidiomarina salinarum]|uniref:Dihydropteroate synthase n=1 Tax=Pseudidiomarina salinarum TaxID=435908 RepID=A0A094IV16_9GAMM|nr:dihydropteroate synthase [Pseudidiomarina salinarum]KFZ31525.1 dihydropteroate synthase [Pseudidiomarina salinarum]RUO70709.1 dihydropteroate synthase [Pseudidiomarina salinarum]
MATAPIKVMGIVNVTPDSFSDGGKFNQIDEALRHAEQLVADGAAWLDIGGESTRPGAPAVSTQQELDRVIPVIERLRSELAVPLSVDTSKATVMREAVAAGVAMINDVRALREDGALAAAAASQVEVCLMHMQGEPRTMQQAPVYEDVVCDVKSFLQERIKACTEAGIARERIYLDPGFGFGKSIRHNYELLHRLQALHELQLPLLVGVSRKSMLGQVTGRDVSERLPASLAAATIAAMKGAHIIRVHDVRETVDAMKIVAATLAGEFN